MIPLILLIAGASAAGAAAGNAPLDTWTAVLNAWEKAIKTAVEDDAGKETALNTLEEARGKLASSRMAQGEALQGLFEIDGRYKATVEDYEPAIAKLNEIWRQADKEMLDRRFKVKEMLPETEWKAVLEVMKKKTKGIQKDVDKAVEKSKKARADQEKDLKKAEDKAAKK
jgi:hypothetical protein